MVVVCYRFRHVAAAGTSLALISLCRRTSAWHRRLRRLDWILDRARLSLEMVNLSCFPQM